MEAFSLEDVQYRKEKDHNTLVFSIPSTSGLLVTLLDSKCPNLWHRYQKQDLRWIHALQSVAIIPSRKVEVIFEKIKSIEPQIPSAKWARAFQLLLVPLLQATSKAMIRSLCEQNYSEYANIGLLLKEKSAQLVRNWMADPVDGCVIRKKWVVGSYAQDDLVSTPLGAGYIRLYRPEDRICVVVYPWGNGWVHLDKIKSITDALKDEEKMKAHGFFTPLEHQHLYENVLESPYSIIQRQADDEWKDSSVAFMKESSQLSAKIRTKDIKPFPLYEKTSDLQSHVNLIKVLKAERDESMVLQNS